MKKHRSKWAREQRAIMALARPAWERMKGDKNSVPLEQAVPGFLMSVQLLFDQGYCLTDVGLMFGLSRERIRQITARHGLTRFVTATPPRIWSWEQRMFVPIASTKGRYRRTLAARARQTRLDGWQERFWKQVAVTASNEECWLWQGGIHQVNIRIAYGASPSMPGTGTKTSYAHRTAYLLAYGEVTPGMQICHTCDVGICCNPHHLFEGTGKDNIQDAMRKGRHIASPQRRAEFLAILKNNRPKLVAAQKERWRRLSPLERQDWLDRLARGRMAYYERRRKGAA